MEEHKPAIAFLQQAAQRFDDFERQVALAPAEDLSPHLRW